MLEWMREMLILSEVQGIEVLLGERTLLVTVLINYARKVCYRLHIHLQESSAEV